MNNIDEILERLKGAQPEIDNPDEFTNLIMSALPDCKAAPEKSGKNERIIKFVRWALSAAAVLLIGLYLYINDIDGDTPTTTQNNYHLKGFSYGDYLKNVYTNRHNKASINYLQLKKLHYENH
ncbi:MAG: hypothetical protein IKM98_04800 [Bacteroidales bacterium]|nr:hypothetical protein [Bacteroidales bacterium]